MWAGLRLRPHERKHMEIILEDLHGRGKLKLSMGPHNMANSITLLAYHMKYDEEQKSEMVKLSTLKIEREEFIKAVASLK